MVSIHALLAECDGIGMIGYRIATGFNPRTPCGVRRPIARLPDCSTWFQSTHSLRSATPAGETETIMEPVSIHALLAECDSTGGQPPRTTKSFNPRTPCGVRLTSQISTRFSSAFQSTHSLRSATYDPDDMATFLREVSIHALLAECDSGKDSMVPFRHCFNPRTPCGVRQGETFYT